MRTSYSSVPHVDPFTVTALCTLATSLALAFGGAGLAVDPWAAAAAMMAGIPWPLALRWEPEAWLVGVVVTFTAMALNVYGLWWWTHRFKR